MDNQSMPEPIPGTEEYGARPAPRIVEDEGQAVTVVIEGIRSGQFSLECGRLLAQLSAAVEAQCSKGKLTIELELSKEDGDEWLTLSGAAKATMPKMTWPSIWFRDERGHLTRNSPQSSFGF